MLPRIELPGLSASSSLSRRWMTSGETLLRSNKQCFKHLYREDTSQGQDFRRSHAYHGLSKQACMAQGQSHSINKERMPAEKALNGMGRIEVFLALLKPLFFRQQIAWHALENIQQGVSLPSLLGTHFTTPRGSKPVCLACFTSLSQQLKPTISCPVSSSPQPFSRHFKSSVCPSASLD